MNTESNHSLSLSLYPSGFYNNALFILFTFGDFSEQFHFILILGEKNPMRMRHDIYFIVCTAIIIPASDSIMSYFTLFVHLFIYLFKNIYHNNDNNSHNRYNF